MKSVVNDTDGIVRVAESVIPEIKHQDEVRVKIASSGLCGSDLPRIFKNGAHYYPITLGHEFSGYIDAVGSGVDDLHPGDAVACVPLLPCFTCPECLKGFIPSAQNMILLARGVMVDLLNILSLSEKMSLLYPRICLLRMGLLLSRLPLVCMLFI